MRRFLAFALAATLLFALAACGEKTPTPGPTTTAPDRATAAPGPTAPAGEYAYEIRTTVDTSPYGIRNPVYQFSRPFFDETSALAREANQVYAKAEAEFTAEMKQANADNADLYVWEEEYFDPGAPLYYKELTESAYEADGMVSFTTTGEWFMGGVSNFWITGHTFDFNLGRELKITDVLRGDSAQVTAALEGEFYAWYAAERGDRELGDIFKANVTEQSGPAANFYLAGDGVHVCYRPYTVPATQGGVELLIPWGSALVGLQLP